MQRALMTGIVAILAAQTALAQGVSVGPDGVKLSGFGVVDEQKSIDAWAANEKKNMMDPLVLQIELIQEVCDLNEEATAKLHLAAQGVVSRRLLSGRNQLLKFIVDSDLIEKAPQGFEDLSHFQRLLRASQCERLSALESRATARLRWGNPNR